MSSEGDGGALEILVVFSFAKSRWRWDQAKADLRLVAPFHGTGLKRDAFEQDSC